MNRSKKAKNPAMNDPLVSDLQNIVDQYSAKMARTEPDWEPLESLLPEEWWDGWMYMGSELDIRMYKHGITRRYLNIDSAGNCYRYNSDLRSWQQVDQTAVIDWAYEGIEDLRETRESKFDDAFITRKHEALNKLGYVVISNHVKVS